MSKEAMRALDSLAHLVGWVALRHPDLDLLKPAQDAMTELRAALSLLRAELEAGGEPVAWANEGGLERMNKARTGYVESPLLTVNAKRTDLFTIPLYASPVAADTQGAVTQQERTGE